MKTRFTSILKVSVVVLGLLAMPVAEVTAQKNNHRLWLSDRKPNRPVLTSAGSQARTNALVSRPGNSEDYTVTGSGSWQLQSLSIYTYDSQGRVTNRLYTTPASGQNLGREITAYDSRGNETEYRVEEWNGTGWNLSDGYKTLTTYNSKGQKTEIEYEYWDGSNWVKDSREDYVYDANDLLTSLTYSRWAGSGWEFTDRMNLTHNGGTATSALMQEYINNAWVDAYRAQNISWHKLYETPSAYEMEYFDGNNWVKEEKYSAVYDANGGHEGIYQNWNGSAWENHYRETETYDNNQNFTGWLDETWNQTTSAWEPEGEEKQLLTYSGIDITERIFQDSWTSPTGALENRYREVYSNFQTFNISGVNDLLAQNEVKIYPNPTSGQLRIAFNENNGHKFTATVLDITGKTWQTQTFQTGENPHLNLEILPKGIYLLQLQTEKGLLVKRVVKQ